MTRDVDATVVGGLVPLPALVRLLLEYGLVPRIPDALEFAGINQVLLLRHEPTGVDVDLSIAWLPFELAAIDAAEPVAIAGLKIPIALAEDLIIYKAVAFRPQDQQDIERLLGLYRSSVDLDRVRRVVAEFADALEEPDRLRDLETLIRKAGPAT